MGSSDNRSGMGGWLGEVSRLPVTVLFSLRAVSAIAASKGCDGCLTAPRVRIWLFCTQVARTERFGARIAGFVLAASIARVTHRGDVILGAYWLLARQGPNRDWRDGAVAQIPLGGSCTCLPGYSVSLKYVADTAD